MISLIVHSFKRWTEEEKKQALAMLLDGKSYEEIGEKLGRSWESIRGVWKQQDEYKMQRQEKRIVWHEIAVRYRMGETAQSLADEYGFTVDTVRAKVTGLRQGNPKRKYMKIIENPESLAPLTDWPKWPGCQCGYCSGFCGAKLMKNGNILGTCTALRKTVNRSDFCTAPEPPVKGDKYPIVLGGRLVWLDQMLDRGYDRGKWRKEG